MSRHFENRTLHPRPVQYINIHFVTTAAAQDLNRLVLQAIHKPILVVDARLVFVSIDTFASGVDIDLETDDGTTEVVCNTYDTDADTAVDTVLELAPVASGLVAVGSWLQLRVDDDEDVACEGDIAIAYVELDG